MTKTILAVILSAATALLTACATTDDSQSKTDATQQKVSVNTEEQLQSVAHNQAVKFVEISGSETMKAQEILLNVRSKETQLRRANKGALADYYVEQFTSHVAQIDPALADSVF